MKAGFWLWHSIFMTLTYCMFWRVWKPTDDWLLLHKRSGDTLMIHSPTLPGTTFSIPFDQLVGCVVFASWHQVVELHSIVSVGLLCCETKRVRIRTNVPIDPTFLRQPNWNNQRITNEMSWAVACHVPMFFNYIEYVRVKRAQFRHDTSVCKDVSSTWAGVCTGGLNDCMRCAWGKHLDRLQNAAKTARSYHTSQFKTRVLL